MPITLSGMDELLARLARTNVNVNIARKKALNKGAEIIKKSASEKAPRDNSARNLSKKYSPGQHLADNLIISEVKGQGNNQYVEVGPQRGDNNDFFYGKFLEFGTTKMLARPFMEPAFVEKRKEALEVMAEVIKEAIESNV